MLIILVVLTIAAVFCVYYIQKIRFNHTSRRELNPVYIWLKLCSTNWYVISAALAFQSFNFSDELNSLMKTQRYMQSFGTIYLEFQCLFQGSPETTLWRENMCYLLTPLLIIAGMFLLSKCTTPENWITTGISVSMVFMYLIQPTVSEHVWTLLPCTQLGTDDWVLSTEFSIACEESVHVRFLILVGAPMFFIYVICVPVLGVIIVVRNKLQIALLATTTDPDTGETYLYMKNADSIREKECRASNTREEIERAENFLINFGFLFLG